MLGEDLLIKKYPYMSFSPNLMEYFCVIGYKRNFIPTLIDDFSKKNKNCYPPTILSSINSSNDYGIVDNELIISQVYPDNPKILQNNKNDIIIESPTTSNVIYSLICDKVGGKSKIIYNCFAYKFYEKMSKKNSGTDCFYIPKALCIISQYPFFTVFENICKNIYALMNDNQNSDIPVELIVYNIVNYVPSPMNYCIQLDLFSFCMTVPTMELRQLSGYPYIDFDLKEIFNILPINFFLEVYFFTCIEQCMLFFSSNLEILNMVMYIMYILNFPCNDSAYFWHIVSVSKNNIKADNKFVGKVMAKLLGVHSAYDDEIDTFAFEKYHYIVDIDNKRIFLKQSLDLSVEDIASINSLNNLQTYIQNIVKEKMYVESSFLKPFIIKVKRELEQILYKGYVPSSYNKDYKYKSFFRMDKDIYNTNRKIQQLFYDFFLNILMIFYQDNSLINDFTKIQKVDCRITEQNIRINSFKINDRKIDMTEEEQSFCEFFRLSLKYTIYFENFIRDLEGVDICKIALLFSDEFINIKMKDEKNIILNKISLFDIIDTLYFPPRQQTINITINNLFSFYPEKLRDFFEEFIVDEKKTQLINLNKKIINRYIYMLNNIYEKKEIYDLFPSIRIQEEQLIIDFDRRYINNIIQNRLETHIKTSDYIIYGFVYIFCISMSLHPYQEMILFIGEIINPFFGLQFFLRQYIYIIIQSLYKYYLLHKEKQTYPQFCLYCIRMYYSMLLNCLRQNYIIPNEEIMSILDNVIGKKNDDEDKCMHKENCDTYFEIKKNENFLCFMKHCFSNKQYYNSKKMITYGLKEKNNCNIFIQSDKKILLKPTIEIKINDYTYSGEFFSAKKVFKLSENCFNDFYETNNMDFSKIKVNDIRNCIANLIQYGIVLENIHTNYLVYSLYFLKDYEEKYGKKNN